MPDLRSAAFRTEPFRITYQGLELAFRYEPAAVWMDALNKRSWVYHVLQFQDTDTHERMLDAIGQGEMSEADLPRIARAALAEAGGRAWWEIDRLTQVVYSDGGRLLGSLVLAGVDPMRITLAAWCAAVWARLVQGADTQQTMKIESQLVVPPPEATEDELAAADEAFGNVDVARLRQMPGISIG